MARRVGITLVLVALALFLAEFLGYWASRLMGDAATIGLYAGAIVIGISAGQSCTARVLAVGIAVLCSTALGLANLLFLRWLQLSVFERMDEQIFGYFLPVYIGVMLVPAVILAGVIGAVAVRQK